MTWKPLGDHETKATPIKTSLGVIAGKIGCPSPATLSALFAGWSGVVGEELGGHCRPDSLSNGVLVVHTDDQRWATQLCWMTGTVLERLNDLLGDEVVTRVDVRATPHGSRK